MINRNGRATRLTTKSGNTLAWVPSRCLLSAPWNIACKQCRNACPEGALEVVISDQTSLLTATDACTHCHECLSACDTEALLASSTTLTRRDLFRRLASPALPTVAATDAAPAPRKRWRMEAAQADSKRTDPISHPRVFVDFSRCDASNLCSQLCPSEALQTDTTGALIFDSHHCLGCGKCENVCPNQAISLKEHRAPFRDILRQSERRECGECGHPFQQISDGLEHNEDWSQLPLCPACRRNQTLMKTEVMSLFR